MDFLELWQPLISQHPVWLLAVSCQQLSSMHLQAELFLIVNQIFMEQKLMERVLINGNRI